MKNVLLGLVAIAVLSGCAAAGPQVASDDASIRVAPTGSNMLRKESQLRSHGVTAYDKEAFDQSRREPAPATAPAGGGPK
jgi:hypothetical protein